MQYELISSLLILNFIVVGLSVAGFSLYRSRIQMQDSLKETEVALHQMRADIEQQLYKLNREFQNSEIRWKDVNHLIDEFAKKSASQKTSKSAIDVDFFLNSLGVDKDAPVDDRLVFVLIPFHPSFNAAFHVIESNLQDTGLVAERGDEHSLGGTILSTIVQKIITAKLVIAVLDGRNPNVFYELGIAHALGKEVLLLARSDEPVSFDLQHRRIFFYSDLKDLERNFSKQVINAVISTPN